jgi:hypothetical protein
MFPSVRIFIKDLMLSGLLGKAHKLYMCKNYADAIEVLNRVIDSKPSEFIMQSALYSGKIVISLVIHGRLGRTTGAGGQ